MDEFMLGQWCCDTSAIYRKKGQTWCSREAYKIMFIHYFKLQLSVVTGGLLLNRLISKPAVVQLHT